MRSIGHFVTRLLATAGILHPQKYKKESKRKGIAGIPQPAKGCHAVVTE
jgi:hypothetical protein